MLISHNSFKLCIFCVKKERCILIYLESTIMDMKQKDFTKKLFFEIIIVLIMVALLLLIFNNF